MSAIFTMKVSTTKGGFQSHYENKLTKNIGPTDSLQIYTSI